MVHGDELCQRREMRAIGSSVPVGSVSTSEHGAAKVGRVDDRPLRKFSIAVPSGRTEYRILHNLQSEDVIVQTRIAGRIREGGVSILDANTIQLTFGGVLNESMEVVVIG